MDFWELLSNVFLLEYYVILFPIYADFGIILLSEIVDCNWIYESIILQLTVMHFILFVLQLNVSFYLVFADSLFLLKNDLLFPPI